MRYRIESDGTPHGTRVIELETGAELKGIAAINVLPFTARSGLVRAEIELVPCELDMVVSGQAITSAEREATELVEYLHDMAGRRCINADHCSEFPGELCPFCRARSIVKGLG